MADAKTTTKTAESTGSAWEAPKQRVKTLDSSEPDIGWTNQAPTRPEEPPEANPVTLAKKELPDEKSVAEQGVDVETYMANFKNVE